MYCIFCGKENGDDQKFCKYCGKNMNIENRSDLPEQLEKDMLPVDEKPGGKSKVNTMLKWVIAVLVVLILGILGVGLTLFVRNGNKRIEVEQVSVQEETGSKTYEVEEAEISEESRTGTDNTGEEPHKDEGDSEDSVEKSEENNDQVYVAGMLTDEQKKIMSSRPEWVQQYIGIIEKLSYAYADTFTPPVYELIEINGDDVPEMIAFSNGGAYAWVIFFRNSEGQAYLQKLFDNKDKPEGFTDYGAYASIDCANSRIVYIQYDSTYEEDGGWMTPGAELMDTDGRPFDEYIFLTMLEMNENNELVPKDSYSCNYHYKEKEPTDEDYYYFDKKEFIKATHGEESITESEFQKVYSESLESDFDFGSPQSAAMGLPPEEMVKLLLNETFTYEVGQIFDGDDSVTLQYEYINSEGYRVPYIDYVKLADLPSGIKEGDKIYYSFDEGWSKEFK